MGSAVTAAWVLNQAAQTAKRFPEFATSRRSPSAREEDRHDRDRA
jgi:hypothetical protein